jgi:hypothetical protein
MALINEHEHQHREVLCGSAKFLLIL